MLETGYPIDTLLVPIGGGGLISGVAVAAKTLLPSIQVVGVQSERYPSAHHAFYGLDPSDVPDHDTIADGIAVKSPGALTMSLIRRYVDDIVLVSEDDIEQAIFMLAEIEKTVVEGAGAAGVAAAMRHKDRYQGQHVGTILCGGNIDMMTLSAVLQRGMVRSHRLVRLEVEVPDIPGALGQVAQLVGELHSNIMEISPPACLRRFLSARGDRGHGVAASGRRTGGAGIGRLVGRGFQRPFGRLSMFIVWCKPF